MGPPLPTGCEAEHQALVGNEIPPPPEFTEPLSALLMRVAKLVGRVPPTKRLKKPHREIAQLLAADEERLAKWQKSSYPSSFDQPFYLSPYDQRRLKLDRKRQSMKPSH